jgi:hypothetical protein
MGKSNSKNVEQKTIESDGQVNNNFVIQETVDVYNKEIIVMLAVIAFLKLLEFAYFIYKEHSKMLKKRFERNQKFEIPN